MVFYIYDTPSKKSLSKPKTQPLIDYKEPKKKRKIAMSVDSMTRHMSPVNPAVYPHLTLVLLTIGIFFTAWFFVYEVTSTKITRDIFKNGTRKGKDQEDSDVEDVMIEEK
ncbi:Transmembrane protein [Armadillidium vulgare]|nr:Transmembrane protein [Armadillidium vulgare]